MIHGNRLSAATARTDTRAQNPTEMPRTWIAPAPALTSYRRAAFGLVSDAPSAF